MPDPIELDSNIMALLAALAHEINTPLGAIKSNNDILDQAFGKIGEWINGLPEAYLKPDIKEILHIVEVSLRTNGLACERLISVVGSVRSFARLENTKRSKTDIHDCIENTLAILAHVLKGRIEVVKDYGRVGQVDGYHGQLHQLFMNIILNAAQAIEGEGKIRVKTWETGNAVHVAISDTGRGIPPDVLPRIFDLGFTTKKADAGAGLGLSISRKVIQNHNGRIDVDSEVGKGSTFTIVLPVTQDPEKKPNG
jgi:two-component system, NtrC family, sensor kinase